jgi:putative membrane protein
MPTTNPTATRNWAIFLVVVVLAVVAVVAVAKTSRTRFSDAQFAAEAAQGGLAEVQLGRLAEQKSENQSVRAFARRMVTDHKKANEKLERVATQANITLPEGLDKESKQTYDKLSQLSGSAFDRAYAEQMIKDHKKDVSAFKKETSDGKNETIKAFANETLPSLQDHLKVAREMEANMSEKNVPTVPK